MSRLLCIDWDFWFPNPMESGDLDDPRWQLMDWGNAETPIFLSLPVWLTRAAGFIANGFDLPGVVPPEGGWKGFWDRFTFAPGTTLLYADSNAYAGLVEPPDGAAAFGEVLLFDAHHDSGYNIESIATFVGQETFSCEDWMLVHQQAGTPTLTVRYPQWKPGAVNSVLPQGVRTEQVLDDGLPVPEEFDAVFVCRSGAWVPPWCDSEFLGFIEACPLNAHQVDETTMDRHFDAQVASELAAQMGSARVSSPD